ncbi:MAG: dephospho-CoA kinase [Gammaproteobacteria bacterium]|nr:dephospho-CoA kinase [Gammaproteobacteria bacterium]
MTTQRDSNSFRIALTGGIASGKSVVTEMFRELGAAVVDTDVIAREVVQPGQPALDEVRDRFGDSVIRANGELDRKALRRLVFEDAALRRDLEAILHPRIGAETRRQAMAAGGSYQLIVVPLLVGSALLDVVDRVLVVDCDEQTQLRRLLARDAESPEQARRMLAAQTSREQRLAIADDVIRNDGSLEDTRRQVARLDKRYRRLARSQRRCGSRP